MKTVKPRAERIAWSLMAIDVPASFCKERGRHYCKGVRHVLCGNARGSDRQGTLTEWSEMRPEKISGDNGNCLQDRWPVYVK